MNILFYTTFNVCPQNGGTERITWSLANALVKRNKDFFCYSVYKLKHDFTYDTKAEGIFSKEKQAESVSDIAEFIIKNSVDICIVQGVFAIVKPLRTELKRLSSNCKILFVHHYSPGYETNFFTAHQLLNSLAMGQSTLKILPRLLFYPVLQLYKVVHLHILYHSACLHCDKVVLLSEKFIEPFSKYAFIKNKSKFWVIPNMLSYSEFIDENLFSEKNKTVLIVSRLEETQKRIKLALKIWRLVKKDVRAKDWKLIIVGDGSDKSMYEKFALRHSLQDVFFEGQREPRPYYLKSSIFMLTSFSEGWGLTLTEAQQFGCVPVAFNTYASLVDIITDGENGYVIQECDLKMYAQRILALMTDNNLLRLMAKNGIKTSGRFSPESVVSKWCELFKIMNSRGTL